MNEEQLVQHLEQIAAKEIPDDMNKWPDIHAQLVQRRTRSRAIRRTLSGIAAALAIVVTGLVGYAFSQGPSGDPGLDQVQEMGLLQPLNLTETHDNMTITLTEGYADANRIAIWMTIETDEQPVLLPAITPVLSYANGDFLNAGLRPMPLDTTDPNRQQLVVSFDLVEVLPDDQPVDLRLTINVGGTPVPNIPDGVTLEPGPIPPEYMIDVPALAPFVFTFQLDVQQALILTPQQTAEANGLAVMLDQVTLTPSQITLRLCFDLPDGGDWQPKIAVQVDDVAGNLMGYRLTKLPNPAETRRCADYDIALGVTPESRQLEVTVDRLQTSASFTPESIARAQERLAAQGITVEFEIGQGGFNWKIVSAPEGMDESAIGLSVWDALSEQYAGPWSFTVDLLAND